MTTAPDRRARQVADRLRAEGWDVVDEPPADALPRELREFRPDLLAARGDKRLVVEIRGLRMSGRSSEDLEVLTQRLATTPDWDLELVWPGEDDPPAPRALLEDRARRAQTLADSDPEAALMLAWSAAEGALVDVAERAGLSRTRSGAGLVTELSSRGLVTEEQYEVLRVAQQHRHLVAHGRVAEDLDPRLVQELVDLLRAPELMREALTAVLDDDG